MDRDPASAAMLQEAQSKVSTLMGEVYSLRREAFEAKQALNQALSQRNSLTQRISDLEVYVADLQPAAERAIHLEASLTAAEAKIQALQQQVAALEQANAALQGQAATDQASRKRADDTRTWADAERSRLQRARDELALKVKTLEQRLADMEDEQAASEHALASARQELASHTMAASPMPNDVQQHELLQEEQARAAALLQALHTEQAAVRRLQQQLDAASTPLTHVQALQQRCEELEAALAKWPQADNAAAAVGGVPSPQPAQPGANHVELDQLHTAVVKLKASRDRLLAQLDAQAAELDRLSGERAALEAGLAAAEDASARLMTQLQGSLEQNERLKDLLDESAQWAGATVLARENLAAAVGAPRAEGGAEAAAAAAEALAVERARVVDLDLQVRALCAELTRALQANAAVNNNVLPLLSNIEDRLEGVARLSVDEVLRA